MTYKLKAARFLRKYTADVRTPTYAAATDAEKIVDSLCDVAWVKSSVAQARVTSHTNDTETRDTETKSGLDWNVDDRESFDAAVFCADHDGGMHRAYANAACYRFEFPDMSSYPNLTQVKVRATSDPYNKSGLRIAVLTSATGVIPTACATCRTGDFYAEGVAPREVVTATSGTTWYPVTETETLTPSATVQLKKYLFVFVLKESYGETRGNWLEGSGFIDNLIEITTSAAIAGWTDGATYGDDAVELVAPLKFDFLICRDHPDEGVVFADDAILVSSGGNVSSITTNAHIATIGSGLTITSVADCGDFYLATAIDSTSLNAYVYKSSNGSTWTSVLTITSATSNVYRQYKLRAIKSSGAAAFILDDAYETSSSTTPYRVYVTFDGENFKKIVEEAACDTLGEIGSLMFFDGASQYVIPEDFIRETNCALDETSQRFFHYKGLYYIDPSASGTTVKRTDNFGYPTRYITFPSDVGEITEARLINGVVFVRRSGAQFYTLDNETFYALQVYELDLAAISGGRVVQVADDSTIYLYDHGTVTTLPSCGLTSVHLFAFGENMDYFSVCGLDSDSAPAFLYYDGYAWRSCVFDCAVPPVTAHEDVADSRKFSVCDTMFIQNYGTSNPKSPIYTIDGKTFFTVPGHAVGSVLYFGRMNENTMSTYQLYGNNEYYPYAKNYALRVSKA